MTDQIDDPVEIPERFIPKNKFGPFEHSIAEIRKLLVPDRLPRDEAIIDLMREYAKLRKAYLALLPVKEKG